MKNKTLKLIACTFLLGMYSFHSCNAGDLFSKDMLRSLPQGHAAPMSSSVSVDFKLGELEEQIRHAEAQVQSQLKQEIGSPTRVLILGTTGSGKSTLVHGLSDKKLIAEAGTGSYRIKVLDEMLPGFTIGHQLDSATTIPVSWYDRSANLAYWDCPGFMDSRGERQEIVNAFSIDQIFSPPSRIKVLLAIQESDFEGARGMKVMRKFEKVISLLPNPEQLKQALSVVVTKKIDRRFTSHEKLKGLLERSKKAQGITGIEKSIDLLNYLVHNPDRIFTFPEPTVEGLYNDFLDKGSLISHLKRSPVENPKHLFELDTDVKILMLEMLTKFANVPSILFELEDVLHLEYRGKGLESLKAWNNFTDSFLKKIGDIDSPTKLFSELTKVLPAIHTPSVFRPLLDKLTRAQRYINFAKKVELGCGENLDIPVVSEILFPILKNAQSELRVLIENKEFLKRQEEASKQLEAKLNQEVQSGALARTEAEKQIKDLKIRAEQEKSRSDRELDSLRNQLSTVNSQAQRERQSALEAQERRYDSQMNDLRRQLRDADQSALISRLRDRIEELESQLRRSQGSYGIPFSSGPFMGPGGGMQFVPGLGWVRFG
jgi:hypothetical protein